MEKQVLPCSFLPQAPIYSLANAKSLVKTGSFFDLGSGVIPSLMLADAEYQSSARKCHVPRVTAVITGVIHEAVGCHWQGTLTKLN